jgi:hypothetical protein
MDMDEPPEQEATQHTNDISEQEESSNAGAGQPHALEDSEDRNVTADERDRLYEKWNNKIDLLVQPYLDSLSRTFGKRHEEADGYETTCTNGTCLKRKGKFRGLHFDRKLSMMPL